MAQASAYIHGMGHYHPQTVLDNDFFDALNIGSDAAWVEERTGIVSRRSVLAPEDILAMKEGRLSLQDIRDAGGIESLASISKQAWQHLKERQPNIENPRLLICGTSVPDYYIPANACTIAKEIGIQATAFDANSACSSFVVDIHLARSLIASGQHESIAIFNPERYSARVDFNDKNSCVLFGDGAACAYISNEPKEGSLKVLDTVLASDPEGCDHVKIPDEGYFSQNGRAVQKFAISRTIEVTRATLDRNRLSPDDIQYFIGHQANLRMISSAAERLGIPAEKHLYNVDHYGNQGAAGAPAVLSMNWQRFKKGDRIMVAVVGSGLTWGGCLLEVQ